MRIIRSSVRPKGPSSHKNSKLEAKFLQAWALSPLDDCPLEQEYRFCERRWRFDIAYPLQRVAVELNGGSYRRGRHNRGKGVENDYEKLNAAQRLGWVVLQYGSSHLSSHRKAREVVREVCTLLRERLNATEALRFSPETSRSNQQSKRPQATIAGLPVPISKALQHAFSGADQRSARSNKQIPSGRKSAPRPIQKSRR